MKYEFAIAVIDKPDLPSGHKTSKRGDIIAIKPYPWGWGIEEEKRYLIVTIDNLTPEEIDEFASVYYENDITPGISDPAVITAKRKFNLNIDQIKAYAFPSMDDLLLTDMTVRYQPLKDAGIVLNADILPANFSLMINKYTGSIRTGKKQ